MLAAPIIIQTGEPVMARGGFHGLDPILTPDKLARMVDANEVRFAMLNDLSLVSRRMGAETAGRPLADWVRANGKLVDPALWRPGPEEQHGSLRSPPSLRSRVRPGVNVRWHCSGIAVR